MKRRNLETDTDHIIPSSRKDEGFDTEAPINKKEMRVNKHRSKHTLFRNDLPHEAIHRWVEDYCGEVFTQEFKDRINTVLMMSKEEIYIQDVLEVKKTIQKDVEEILDNSDSFFDMMKESLPDGDIEFLKQYYRSNAPKGSD